jgi:heme exporter protein D
MIPDYLANAITLAVVVYILQSLLEIYFMLRDEYKEQRQKEQPKQPAGYFQ